MRDIKFRGIPIDPDKNDFIYGDLRHIDNDFYICQWKPRINAVKVIPETVGQYIERKDKNGKEIYDKEATCDNSK